MSNTTASNTAAKIAFVFPGQGAQAVGMGQDLAEANDKARAVFDVFDARMQAAGHQTISAVCFNGPEETLRQTLYTQPGILAASLAALFAFSERCPIKPHATAGHSLGEYGALVASGVVDVETAARLVIERATLMDKAPAGAMSAVLGLAEDKLQAIVDQCQAEHPEGVITVANYNTPDQIVISGTPELLELAAPKIKEAGAKRVLPLPVGGAFHSPLMRPPAEAFQAFLKDFAFAEAEVPVVTNVDARPTTVAGELHDKLGRQIDHAVRWTQTMDALVNGLGVDTVVEFGPGKVLTGMIKKFAPDVAVYNVNSLASLDETVAALRPMAAV